MDIKPIKTDVDYRAALKETEFLLASDKQGSEAPA